MMVYSTASEDGAGARSIAHHVTVRGIPTAIQAL